MNIILKFLSNLHGSYGRSYVKEVKIIKNDITFILDTSSSGKSYSGDVVVPKIYRQFDRYGFRDFIDEKYEIEKDYFGDKIKTKIKRKISTDEIIEAVTRPFKYGDVFVSLFYEFECYFCQLNAENIIVISSTILSNDAKVLIKNHCSSYKPDDKTFADTFGLGDIRWYRKATDNELHQVIKILFSPE